MQDKIKEKFIESFQGNIAHDLLDELAKKAVPIAIASGSRLFASGDPCENFIFILSGKARIRLSLKTGREVTLFHLSAGQSCALTTSCLLTQSPYYAEGIAETDLEIITISAAEFDRIIAVSPRWSAALLQDYSRRIGGLIALVDSLSARDIDTRLNEFLQYRAAPDGIITLSHKAIAEELGTAREVISRKLKKLENNGIVKMARGRIQILKK